jgi:UDP-N-acetylmuramate--alanine ligase
VLDVYGAREDPIPGVTGKLVADATDLPQGRVHYEPAVDRVPALVAGVAAEGDLVVTMGAGDVTLLGPKIIAELDHPAAG